MVLTVLRVGQRKETGYKRYTAHSFLLLFTYTYIVYQFYFLYPTLKTLKTLKTSTEAPGPLVRPWRGWEHDCQGRAHYLV